VTGLRLILARHGQTDSNVRMAIDSLPPGGPLTEQGQQQARELADALATEPVDAVYASTALRAQQTARPVAERHGLAVQVVEGIHEISVGDLEGRNDRESLRTFADVFGTWARDGDLSRPMPGGETGQQAFDRFTAGLRTITADHEHGVLVVVTHGALLRLVGPLLAENLNTLAEQLSLLQNTARIVLVEDHTAPGGWHCVEWAGVQLGVAT
jgi:probable phosphoglycerate mutase